MGGSWRLRALVEHDEGLVHATNEREDTPLLSATIYGHVEVARYLLDHGAAINHRGYAGGTPLHYAYLLEHAALVLIFLQRGADVTAVVEDWGETPLVSAAIEGCAAVVRMLLKHGGSDVNARAKGGWTGCHWISSRGHSRVLTQLLVAGADPTVRDTDNRTPLDHAAGGGHHDCIRILQE